MMRSMSHRRLSLAIALVLVLALVLGTTAPALGAARAPTEAEKARVESAAQFLEDMGDRDKAENVRQWLKEEKIKVEPGLSAYGSTDRKGVITLRGSLVAPLAAEVAADPLQAFIANAALAYVLVHEKAHAHQAPEGGALQDNIQPGDWNAGWDVYRQCVGPDALELEAFYRHMRALYQWAQVLSDRELPDDLSEEEMQEAEELRQAQVNWLQQRARFWAGQLGRHNFAKLGAEDETLAAKLQAIRDNPELTEEQKLRQKIALLSRMIEELFEEGGALEQAREAYTEKRGEDKAETEVPKGAEASLPYPDAEQIEAWVALAVPEDAEFFTPGLTDPDDREDIDDRDDIDYDRDDRDEADNDMDDLDDVDGLDDLDDGGDTEDANDRDDRNGLEDTVDMADTDEALYLALHRFGVQPEPDPGYTFVSPVYEVVWNSLLPIPFEIGIKPSAGTDARDVRMVAGAMYREHTPHNWTPLPGLEFDAETGFYTAGADAATMFALMAPDPTFADLGPDHWAYDRVEMLTGHGVIDPTDNFEPGEYVSRALFTRYLVRALDLELTSLPSPFTDVPDTHPDARYIATAHHAGLVRGVGDDRFAPESILTREQSITMLIRAQSPEQDLPTPSEAQVRSILAQFADGETGVSEWARPFVATGVQAGLVAGYPDGTVQGLRNLTHAEVATLIYREMFRE